MTRTRTSFNPHVGSSMNDFMEEIEFDYDPQKLAEIQEQWQHTDALTQTGQLCINNMCGKLSEEEQLTSGRGGVSQYFTTALAEEFAALELRWNTLNDIFKNTYLEEIYGRIEEMFEVGRTRFLRMGPNSCYSYHQDATIRFHLPLYTNDRCIFFDEDYNPYHMAVGKMYIVDTTRYHTTANFGREDRLHIVGMIKHKS